MLERDPDDLVSALFRSGNAPDQEQVSDKSGKGCSLAGNDDARTMGASNKVQEVLRHSSPIASYEHASGFGTDSKNLRIWQAAQFSLIRTAEIDFWRTSFDAGDNPHVKVSVSLELDWQGAPGEALQPNPHLCGDTPGSSFRKLLRCRKWKSLLFHDLQGRTQWHHRLPQVRESGRIPPWTRATCLHGKGKPASQEKRANRLSERHLQPELHREWTHQPLSLLSTMGACI